jgi:hypothetical protein
MAFKFNALTGNFDIVTQTDDIDFSAIQAQVDSIVTDVSDLQTYTETFTTASWSGPVSGKYTLTFLYDDHGKDHPIIQIFELVGGGNYEQVECFTYIDTNKDITISVNQIPDLKFNGKINIS